MLQAIMTEPGRIEYEDVEVPEVGDDQIKIKMKRIGICGSDIHVYHGVHQFTTYPVVQGHEVSAEVVEIGKNVTNVKVGDSVTIQPQVVCGECYPCTHGMYNNCEELKVMGFQTTGMGSEYFVVDAKKALVLPEGMSYDHGAMLEPLAVAVHAVRRFPGIEGKKVVVLGGGTIGNLTAQAAKGMGAAEVLMTEVGETRLKKARECGIEAINTAEEDLGKVILERFGPDRADGFFECIGSEVTMNQAIDLARKGSDIVIVGVLPGNACVNLGMAQEHELTLHGSQMYRVEDFEKAIELVKDGKINFDPLITHRVPFKEFIKGYEIIEAEKGKTMKVMIEME